MEHPGENRLLWFGLLTGPIVWSVYFLVVYAIVEVACWAGLQGSDLEGLNALSFIVLGLTFAALLITFYFGFLAYRTWQRMSRHTANYAGQSQAEQRSGFMAFAGVLLSGLFALTILLNGIPALILRPCG